MSTMWPDDEPDEGWLSECEDDSCPCHGDYQLPERTPPVPSVVDDDPPEF